MFYRFHENQKYICFHTIWVHNVYVIYYQTRYLDFDIRHIMSLVQIHLEIMSFLNFEVGDEIYQKIHSSVPILQNRFTYIHFFFPKYHSEVLSIMARWALPVYPHFQKKNVLTNSSLYSPNRLD